MMWFRVRYKYFSSSESQKDLFLHLAELKASMTVEKSNLWSRSLSMFNRDRLFSLSWACVHLRADLMRLRWLKEHSPVQFVTGGFGNICLKTPIMSGCRCSARSSHSCCLSTSAWTDDTISFIGALGSIGCEMTLGGDGGCTWRRVSFPVAPLAVVCHFYATCHTCTKLWAWVSTRIQNTVQYHHMSAFSVPVW